MTTLADLTDQREARVIAVNPGYLCSQQLADLGFLPGTRIARIGQGPFGGPVVYSVRGTRFALRVSDARQIAVEPMNLESA